MPFIDPFILARCVIIGFFLWSLLCLYVAYRHPDLPRRIIQSVLRANLGDGIKTSETHINWVMLWVMPFVLLAAWIAFEVWLSHRVG